MEVLMKSLSKPLAALALLTPLFSAQAGVVLYTDESAYLAAVGATRAYTDFAGNPNATVSGDIFTAAASFGSCTDASAPASCGTSVRHSNGTITDLGGSSAPNGVASLAWVLNLSDAFAMSFNYVSGEVDSLNLVDAALALHAIDTSSANGFIGLVSDTAFYGAIVVAVFPNGVGNDRINLDDFRVNAVLTVPEPAGLLLTSLALGLTGLARRAAHKASAAPAA
jgi:hypothetical protein